MSGPSGVIHMDCTLTIEMDKLSLTQMHKYQIQTDSSHVPRCLTILTNDAGHDDMTLNDFCTTTPCYIQMYMSYNYANTFTVRF